MIYAQFYQKAVNSSKLIEACGDRAVIILDGRNALRTWASIAEVEGHKRGYLAYQIRRGSSFSKYTTITAVMNVPTPR